MNKIRKRFFLEEELHSWNKSMLHASNKKSSQLLTSSLKFQKFAILLTKKILLKKILVFNENTDQLCVWKTIRSVFNKNTD